MKKIITITMTIGLALSAHASIIQFNFPPGGLSPLNEVPAITNSTGSGGEISGGITFDTDTSLLHVAYGFGSAAGFTDLTGPASNTHIHGPAGPGTNAAVLIPLLDHYFPANNPTNGGVVFGTVAIPTNQVNNLLAGLLYVNVHTALFPGGEIRGQLIPILNHPPVVVCPNPSTVECGGAATVSAQVSDPDGDALVVVWSVKGVPIQTNKLAAGSTTAPVAVPFTAEFPLGTNSVSIAVTDPSSETAHCTTTLTVADTIPPTITKVTATPNVLWPPNHKMIPVQVAATATDVCGATTWKITSVSSSEPVNGLGDNTSPDWEITGTGTLNLRAERSGNNGSRIYTITVKAKDASGNESQPKTVTVKVPHDARDLFN